MYLKLWCFLLAGVVWQSEASIVPTVAAASAVKAVVNQSLADAEGGLIDILRARYPYGALVPPMSMGQRPVPIEVSVELKKFNGIEDTTQTSSFAGGVKLVWYDDFITRIYEEDTSHQSEAPGTQFLPASMVWAPIVFFCEDVSDDQVWTMSDREDLDLAVTWPSPQDPHAKITWLVLGNYNMRCHVDLQLFPFDPPTTCIMSISAPEGHEKVVLFTQSHGALRFLHHDSSESDIWALTDVAWENKTSPTNFSTILFHFKASRHVQHYAVTILMPCICVSFLQLVGLLHPHNPDRPNFFLVILLSFWVIQSAVTSILPMTSKKCGLLNCILFLSLVNVVYTTQSVVALKWLDYTSKNSPLPPKEMRRKKQALLDKIDTACLLAGVVITACLPVLFYL